MKLGEIININKKELGSITRFSESFPDKFSTNGMTFLRSGVYETDSTQVDPSLLSGLHMYAFDQNSTNVPSGDAGAFGNNTWAVFDGLNLGRVFYTTDPTDSVWTEFDLNVTAGTASPQSAFYGNNQWVTANSAGVIMTYSPDFTTWSKFASGTDSHRDVVYANGIWMVVGQNGTVRTSSDGINWTTQTSGVTTDLRKCQYGQGRWVVVGSSNTVITSTDNGVTWNNITISQVSGSVLWTGLAFGQDRWVACANNLLAFSDDGINWFRQNTPVALSGSKLVFAENFYWLNNTNSMFQIIDSSVIPISFVSSGSNYAISQIIVSNNQVGFRINSSGPTYAVSKLIAGTPFISPNHYMRIK